MRSFQRNKFPNLFDKISEKCYNAFTENILTELLYGKDRTV